MSEIKIKVAFLDRDGVINKEVNYLHRREDFDYTENCVEALKKLRLLNYQIIIVTNQAGIARGYYTEEDYQELTAWFLADLANRGVEVLDVFHCPHHPEGSVKGLAVECDCRKPKPGMLHKAMQKYNIDIEQSIMVGDKVSDADAGTRAGLKNCFLVRTGHITRGNCVKYEFYTSLHELILELEARRKIYTNEKINIAYRPT
jgi:D-glycero-D-manno-heptose 1,7-bisphosphate phosphatase